MRKILMLVLLIQCTLIISSYGQGRVVGTVIDGNAKTLASATITLIKSSDSAVVKMSAAGKEGDYSFESVAYGSYLVSITAVGHSREFSPVFEVSAENPSITLKTIELVPQSKSMGAVTVTAKRPLIEQKTDRMIVNVEAAVTNAGATALEVLEKAPGVTVDKDGNVSLKGKQNVQIYIDGKPAYLSGQDLVNLLSNMNANQLDQIEIMTNPPARFDAAGNSGIINLKTKKNKQKGFNGSLSAGYSQGKYWRTNESLNMNYRNGKFNLFMNAGYNNNNSFQNLYIYRTYLHADKTVDAIFEQEAFMPRKYVNHNLKFGLDYFLSQKTTFGFLASGFSNSENERGDNKAYLKDGNGELDSMVLAVNHTKGRWKNGSLNLNFRHQFDSTGRELTADLDYSNYNSKRDQQFVNTSFFPNGDLKNENRLFSNLPVDIDIYSAKMDYSHPTRSGWKFESGVKTSYVSTDNKAEFFNLVSGNWAADYDKTNQFVYKENINAAYVNVSREFKKWGVQGGLRFENTNYEGHQMGNPVKPDSSFNRNYNSIFPTAYVSYKPNANNQFVINLGRRIDRPHYQDLNPFIYFLDNYTYEAGNPFIRPEYTWNSELSHTYKGFLTTTINYSRTTDLITETFEQADYATIVREGNIGVRNNAGIAISAQLKPAKWWNMSLYSNFNHSQFKGALYGEQVDVSASNILFHSNNIFTFGKGWGAELSGFYRTKGVEGQIIIQPLGQASAGLSKQVLKGKGTVRLNVRDMFYSNFPKGKIDFQRTKAYFENRRDSRVGTISFTWRFGKPIKAQQTRKTGGAADEQNRVKTGE
jgi:iron complex outermembrane receptor protein